MGKSVTFSFVCFDNLQGSHIARKNFDEAPLNLAVMDVNARQKWKLAVTLDLKRSISLLEVTPQAIGDVIVSGSIGDTRHFTFHD